MGNETVINGLTIRTQMRTYVLYYCAATSRDRLEGSEILRRRGGCQLVTEQRTNTSYRRVTGAGRRLDSLTPATTSHWPHPRLHQHRRTACDDVSWYVRNSNVSQLSTVSINLRSTSSLPHVRSSIRLINCIRHIVLPARCSPADRISVLSGD